MLNHLPAGLPETIREFLEGALPRLARDARLMGVGAAGSFACGTMDEYSDLDLVVAATPEDLTAVMADRTRIAEGLGPLLAAFTGEHVGEPRLLVCLYGPPALHVDLKFVALPDAAVRVDDLVVLWECDGRLSEALRGTAAAYPQPDPQWIEDRFWVWMHYAATKLGRGELFEVIDFLAFLRQNTLGPLGLRQAGRRPAGVRRLETEVPGLAEELRHTVATYDARACLMAVHACVAAYRRLREGESLIQRRVDAEAVAVDYLDEIGKALEKGHIP